MNAAAAFAQDLPRAALLAAIRFYKRHLSPHKGFACAYRIHTGHCSCSTLGYRAVARYGVLRGLGVLRLRLDRCHEVFERRGARPPRRGQRGFVDCDLPCDGSCPDLPDCSCPCEVLECFDCDWPFGRRERERERARRRRAG